MQKDDNDLNYSKQRLQKIVQISMEVDDGGTKVDDDGTEDDDDANDPSHENELGDDADDPCSKRDSGDDAAPQMRSTRAALLEPGAAMAKKCKIKENTLATYVSAKCYTALREKAAKVELAAYNIYFGDGEPIFRSHTQM